MNSQGSAPLAVERAYFDESLEHWLVDYPGRVVLVKERDLIGVFDTEDDALSEGGRLFGLEPFLVRRVAPQQDIPASPALTLGIISAHITGAGSAAVPITT